MTSIGKWNTPVLQTAVLTTELNSLASGSMSNASATYDNSSNLDLFCDLEIDLAALSPASGAYVAVYLLEAVDGTNFPAQSAADLRLTASQLLCNVPIGVAASTAQRVVVRGIQLPPAKVQFRLDNQTGAALAASGNTVKILTYDYNLNG